MDKRKPMKTILLALLLLGVTINAQIKKDDLAHIEAGIIMHSGTYFLVHTFQDGKGKLWKPFITVNVIGTVKEILDSKEQYNYFSWDDMMYNNIGALISLGLIEGSKALGVPDNVAIGCTLGIGIASFGLTVNF